MPVLIIWKTENGTYQNEKDMIFKERLSENQMTLKFSIPQVKAGTLIEYEYRLESDFFFTIDSWKAQSDIPTLYTEYDIIIPEYFKFNTDMRGTESLETKSESTSLSSLSGAVLPMHRITHEFSGNSTTRLERRQLRVVCR